MITLDQAKSHLNLTTDLDDQLVTDKLAAAKAWVAGYTASDVDADTAPAPVREAVLQLAAQLYARREIDANGITASELPFGFLDLLSPYRAFSF